MVFSDVTKKTTHGGYKRIDLIFGTVFAFLFAIIVGSIIFSGIASAYDFSVTIPEGEVLEVKLFNSDGTTMGSTTSMNVTPTSLSSPGFNEKDVVVSVGTSNEWGYNLVMNVSNTTPVSEQDPNNTIANLTNKSGGYTCTPETAATCDFTVNSWGFKIKANTNSQSATNYIPVRSSITLNTRNSATNGDPVYLSFGSRINAFQKPGTYSTTINFVATAKPDPTPLMQNVSASDLASLMPSDSNTTTLKDSRDNNKYQITNINGTYWMTDNLKIMGTISAAESNFTGADFNISAGEDLTAGNTYTEPRAHYNTSDTNSSTYGAYYNYCAASAGTVCSETTKQDATSDICPKGWRLPTQSEVSNFINTTSSNKNPVLAGFYNSGSLNFASSRGYWWSATAVSDATSGQYFLYYNGSSWNVLGGNKNYAFSVRCVYDIPTMQSVTSAKLAALAPENGNMTTLVDKRDGNEYRITNFNGSYWMTQDLRFVGTVSKNGLSNYSGKDFTIEDGEGDFQDYNVDQPVAISTGGGTRYNYCAASAGTVCDSALLGDADEDICPVNWRLPDEYEYEELSDFFWEDITDSPQWWLDEDSEYLYSVSGANHMINTAWWSKSSSDHGKRIFFFGDNMDYGFDIDDALPYDGVYIRCIYNGS